MKVTAKSVQLHSINSLEENKCASKNNEIVRHSTGRAGDEKKEEEKKEK